MVPDDTLRSASSAEAETQGEARATPGGADEPLQTGQLVDRYVVLHRVGQGGMGVVYAAYDPQLDRKVAIKILRPDVASDAPRQRLLREAQAMARVSHPNVMRVYDVGTVGELVFMAMELVEGKTLGELLHTARPDWRECLRLYLAAGRGLVAAHAAGLVHRDFKPGNVLVGPDGSVRVIDFGVARPDKEATPRAPEVPVALRESSGPIAIDSQLTLAGALVGTPHYMSPEQLWGQPADARSDQFSFCVALHQALFGVRPYAGEDLAQLRTAIARGRIDDSAPGSPVPSRVRRALLRGLQVSPPDRWPSMEALLAELERDPGAKFLRRLAVALTLGAVALAGVSWVALRARARQSCARAGDEIAQQWDEKTKRRVHLAFTETGKPFAEDAWSTTERRLDGYVGEWSTMRTEACLATEVDSTQTREQLALRVSCLEQRRQELAALVEVLGQPDPKVVQGAVSAAHALTPISGCADLVVLRSAKSPPADPASKAKIDSTRAELAAVKGLADSGKIADALTKAKEADALARTSGFAPLIAEALVREGELLGKTGDRKSAEATLQQAVWFAQLGDADELAARAWNQLGFIVGYELGRHAEGEAFCQYASGAIARRGGNPELSAENLRNTGLVLENEGRFNEAMTVLKQSLEVREKLFGAEHPIVATSATSVGNAYIMMEQYAQARPFQERALAIRLKLLGPQHPDTSTSYHNLAICLSHLGERDKAIEYLEKALAVDAAVYGPHSDHTATTRQTLAKAWFETHQPAKAREGAQMALEDLTRAFGSEASSLGPTLLLLGRIALSEGQIQEALDHFHKGLVIREKQLGADHDVLSGYLVGIGECQLALHQPRLALPTFERVGRLKPQSEKPPDDRADVAWGIARALWDGGGDRLEAIARANDAKRLYALAIDGGEQGQRVDAWLETHRH